MNRYESAPDDFENGPMPSKIYLYAEDMDDQPTKYYWQGKIWREYPDGEFETLLESENARTDTQELARNLAKLTGEHFHPALAESYQIEREPSQNIFDYKKKQAEMNERDAPNIRPLNDEEYRAFIDEYEGKDDRKLAA